MPCPSPGTSILSSMLLVVALLAVDPFLGADDAAAPAATTAAAPASLPAPQWVGAVGSRGTVRLTWVRNPVFASVRVYRRTADSPGEFSPIGVSSENFFVDAGVEAGVVYRYRIAGVDAEGREGTRSSELATRITATALAPATPPLWEGHLLVEGGVGLKWSSRPGEDVLVYNIYRRELPDPEFKLLWSSRGSGYLDTGLVAGRSYGYVVTALDSALRETPFSQELTVAYSPARPPAERKVEAAWKVRRTRQVGILTAGGDVSLLRPADVVYGTLSGSVYLADSGRRRVFAFSRDGVYLRSLGIGLNGKVLMETVLGLAADGEENLYAVDAGAGVVQVFGFQGRPGRRIEPQGPRRGVRTGFIDAAIGAEGRLYVVDNRNNRVALIPTDGTARSLGQAGAAAGEFSAPTYCAVDGAGNLYVSDALNARVQVFSPAGEFLRSFGRYQRGPGGLGRPKGLAISASGEVYVADSWFNTVQVFDSSGRFLAILGDEDGRPLDLGSPNGVALGPGNRIAIAERLASRLQIREIIDEPR